MPSIKDQPKQKKHMSQHEKEYNLSFNANSDYFPSFQEAAEKTHFLIQCQ
jgi:hypothetical protein